MKKYLRIIIVFIFIFILSRFFFLFLYRGRTVNYSIEEGMHKYDVHEEYIRNNKQLSSHYYIEIDFDEIKFNFRISDDFDKRSYIVDTIYSFKNDQYICILPIFIDGSIQSEILCQKENIIYPYRSLQNESLELDKFASSMENYGYSMNISEKVISKYGVDILKDNLVFLHKIVIPSYNGVYIINRGEKEFISSVELFNDDIYTQQIQGVISNYYIVADYDSSYSFHEFKLVDLNTKKVSSIVSNNAISMNSYVQGVVDDCLYIIDRSNRKQYKIDISSKSISVVGNLKKGVLYYNGNDFETKSIYDALNNDLLFSLSFYQSSKYDYVYKSDGIYYSYLKTNDGYDVYVSYEENSSLYTYGFSVPSIDKIQYVEEYVYYIDNGILYCYHPKNGVIQVLTYKELFYNSKLNFWVYKK